MKRSIILCWLLLSVGWTRCGRICERGLDSCSADATCADTATAPFFTCTCKDGFTGDGATCTPVATGGACERGVANCSPDATCADVATTPGFTCTCNAGFTGDGVTCADVDECASGEAVSFQKTDDGTEQDCIAPGVCLTRRDDRPIYNAVAESGWPQSDLDLSWSTIPSDTLWTWGACADAMPWYFDRFLGPNFTDGDTSGLVDQPACLELMAEHRFFDLTFTSWTQGAGGGFAYTRTEFNPCGVGGTCTNTPGSFTCGCPAGFTFDGTACVDVDECASPSTNDCDANAVCTNTPGSHTCTCKAGYAWDGMACSDIDECMPYYFTEPSFGTNQDWIAPSVRIARQPVDSIYNSIVDPPFSTGDVPTGTLWALGSCDAVSEGAFGPFLSSSFAGGSPKSILDQSGCLRVVAEGQSYDIMFTSYTDGGPGGGFAYNRTAYCGGGTACQNTDGAYACVPP